LPIPSDQAIKKAPLAKPVFATSSAPAALDIFSVQDRKGLPDRPVGFPRKGFSQ